MVIEGIKINEKIYPSPKIEEETLEQVMVRIATTMSLTQLIALNEQKEEEN